VRSVLFESTGRPGDACSRLPLHRSEAAILGHAEFADWRKATTPYLTGFGKDGHPKALINSFALMLLRD